MTTLIVALIILFLGYFITKKIPILSEYNIPEPVIGGLVFSVFSAILYSQWNIQFSYDLSLKNPLMIMFFTTVGLAGSLTLLRKGGPKVLLFLGVATTYLFVQNAVGVGLALATDVNPLFGLFAGSITLSGGHGTGATYAEMLANSHNLQAVLEVAMAAATMGLVLGGLIGGPVSHALITRHKLELPKVTQPTDDIITYNPDDKGIVTPKRMMETLLILVFCVGFGTVIYEWLKTKGVPIPSFLIPLLLGIVVTNICETSKKYTINKECVDIWGTMALSIFLAMALMSIRIWELVNLAGPILAIIFSQTVVLVLFCYFITFRVMGKNYDAAVIAGGHCGFGLGATPTAVANMESIVSKFGPSPQAFLIVPMVGAFFIDITNALVIQVYFAMPFVH
ncbi:MAG: ESS family glutamate:Na+ symporter [Pseudohongiellaceae bacterium]|jgi:ESS family glutamate:Na+ symporter